MRLNKLSIILIYFIVQFYFAAVALSKAPEVVFMDIGNPQHEKVEDIKFACAVLGAEFNAHFISPQINSKDMKSLKLLEDAQVIILTGRVLKYINFRSTSMIGKKHGKANILILDIDDDTDSASLRILSENRIKPLKNLNFTPSAASIRVIKNDSVSQELGGVEYSLKNSDHATINGFVITEKSEATNLMELIDASGKPVCPVFLKTSSAGRSVFFLAALENTFSNKINDRLRIIPLLMFIKAAFKDRCWHGSNDYANLTVDDPWLIEPYGYISYTDLCREAVKERFHVTFGFIPYNYQRSNRDAVEIFQQCQNNLSLSVHGNNHDFNEFRPAGKIGLPGKTSTDIDPNEKDIIQALYRMNTFSRETGLSFDRVMIFPRGSFTRESLRPLKKHNFLMTVNSMKPLHAGQLADEVDRTREMTSEFENFPVVFRHGLPNSNDTRAMADMKNWIQMRLFLDLPVLLYTHHAFFKNGADQFSKIASYVNTAQPSVEWTGLGNIARHLYLQRRIDDREIEVLSYTAEIALKNTYPAAMKYVVRKQEDFSVPVRSVEVDGVRLEFTKEIDHIRLEVTIEPGREKNIRILYQADELVGPFNYSETDLQTTLVRSLSDFRDLYMTKLPFGDTLVVAFYSFGGVRAAFIGLSVMILFILILSVVHVKRANARKRTPSD